MIRRDWRNKVVPRNNTPFADCKGRFLIHGKIVVSRLFSLDSIREKSRLICLVDKKEREDEQRISKDI